MKKFNAGRSLFTYCPIGKCISRKEVSVNSLAKDMQAIRRLAKAAILRDICPKSMGVSVND